MAWTYEGDPTAKPRDEVRFLIGDTDENDPLVSDGEIAYALATEGNVRRAAAMCCDSIALKFGREADQKGDTQFLSKEKHDHYVNRAKELREQAKSSGVSLFAGGITKSGKQTNELNTDRVQPAFTRDLHSATDLTSTRLNERER